MRYNDSPFDLQTGMFADKDVRDDMYDQPKASNQSTAETTQ